MLAKGPMILAIGVLVGSAHASDKQIWACRTANPDAQPILHLVEWGSRSYVKFTHVRFSAVHENGEEHQGWHWGNEGNGYYRYAVLLEADGKARLHDFDLKDADGMAAPLDTFHCSRTS
jgi:hypothetical protein